ncbi:MAG: hypothetical protein KTR31_24975 [Myxococcales bacterium]|nr:hypothetical protein [Myxococcales bacterium]
MMFALFLWGCVPENPVFESWNALFEVESVLQGPGCELPEEEAEAEEPFIGIGWGVDTRDLTEVLSVYWCPTQLDCRTGPFANAILDVSTQTEVSGVDTLITVTPGLMCSVSWEGVDATQSPSGDVVVDVRRFDSAEVFVNDIEECDGILRANVGVVCDTSQRITARRVQ